MRARGRLSPSYRYAKEEAEKTIQKTIDAFLERIKQENESMDEWEASKMSSDGYEKKGNAYVREAIVDNTMFTTVRKNQSVSLYKWYNVQKRWRKTACWLKAGEASPFFNLLYESYT